MDSLKAPRAQLFAVIDGAMETGARAWKDRASGQSGLFADIAGQEPAAEHPLPNVPDWTAKEKLTGEKEMLGFYITGHPLDQFMDKVGELATHFTSGLEGAGEEHRSRSVRHPHRHPAQAQQGRQALGGHADRGSRRRLEAMVFSTQYERLLPSLNEDQAVLVRGLVLPEENAPPKISVQDIVPLEVARVQPAFADLDSGSRQRRRRSPTAPRLFPNLFARASPARPKFACASKRRRDFSVILDVPARFARTRNSAPRWRVSAERKRWKFWRTDATPNSWPTPKLPRTRRIRVGSACSSRAIPSVRMRSTTSSACSPNFHELHGDRAYGRRPRHRRRHGAGSMSAP